MSSLLYREDKKEKRIKSRYYLLAAFVWLNMLLAAPVRADMEWSGYYKNILLESTTLFPQAESYTLDLNRLRLQLRGDLTEKINFNIEYDNEILLGNYLDTQQFQLQKQQSTSNYFDLEDDYIDTSDAYARHSLYRAYVTITLADVDLRIGRQRIAWGTALLWNPMDILNPLNPVQLERAERPGVDAILLDWNTQALSRLSLVAAKHNAGDTSSEAIRWRTNFKGVDISAMAGNFREDKVLGLDFAGQIKQVGIRGELTRSKTELDGEYNRVVVGADYTFANTLSLSLEYYYNGQGATEISNYQISRWLLGDLQSLARHYLGGFLAYDITPLLRWENILIVNLVDDSYFLFPSLTYSLTENITGSVGMQLFDGTDTSEYGQSHDLYYIQLQWFF